MRFVRTAVPVVCLALSWGCGGSPGEPTSTPTGENQTVTTAGSSSRGSGVSAQTLDGSFRVKPAPNANGIIVLDAGQKLIINANDDRAANPNDTLHLIVSWGDGPN